MTRMLAPEGLESVGDAEVETRKSWRHKPDGNATGGLADKAPACESPPEETYDPEPDLVALDNLLRLLELVHDDLERQAEVVETLHGLGAAMPIGALSMLIGDLRERQRRLFHGLLTL